MREKADFHVHLGERANSDVIDEALRNNVVALGILDREIVRVNRLKGLIKEAASRNITVVPGIESLTEIQCDDKTVSLELLGLGFDLEHPEIFYNFDPMGEVYSQKHSAKVSFQSKYLESLGFCLRHTPENNKQWEIIHSGMALDTAIRLCKLVTSNTENRPLLATFQDQIAAHIIKRPQDSDSPEAKFLFWENFTRNKPGYLMWQEIKANMVRRGECKPDLKAEKLIDLIHQASGVVLVPHPHFRHQGNGNLAHILDQLFEMGVDGVEGWDAGRLDLELAKFALSRKKLVLGGSGQDTTYYSNRAMGNGDIKKQDMFISPRRLADLQSFQTSNESLVSVY